MRSIPRYVAVLSALAIGAGTLGTGVAFAGTTPTRAAVTTPAVAPAVDAPDTATDSGPNVQQGDQSTPDVAGAAAESTAPETEADGSTGTDSGPDIQEGDQSAPDVTAPAPAATNAVAAQLAPATVADETATENGTETATENTLEAGTESATSDGPGGHQDGPGNVDHQFNGNE